MDYIDPEHPNPDNISNKGESPIPESTRRSSRNTTRTEKGRAHEIETLQNRYHKLSTRIDRTIEALNLAMSNGNTTDILKEQATLNPGYNDITQTHRRMCDPSLGLDVSPSSIEAIQLAVTTARLSAVKISTPEDGTSKSVQYERQDARISPSDVSDSKCYRTKSGTKSGTKSSHSNASTGTLTRVQIGTLNALHLGLVRQMSLVEQYLLTYDADIVNNESTKLDKILSDLTDANTRLVELLSDEEKALAQLKWMENIDGDVFQLKKKTCTWLVGYPSNSAKSAHSDRSKNSTKSSTTSSNKSSNTKSRKFSAKSTSSSTKQRAKRAGLKTEAEILTKTMGEKIKAETEKKHIQLDRSSRR